VTTLDDAIAAPRRSRVRLQPRRPLEAAFGAIFWTVVLGVGAYWFFVWAKGGEAGFTWHGTDNVLQSLGRITALQSGYLALIEVLLLARLPFLERLIGFDRLTNWHRWNGHAVLYLVLAHVILSVWGYAITDSGFGSHVSFGDEYWAYMTSGIFPGMIIATIGTIMLIVVLFSSLAMARRKLNYELWYAVHFTAYAAIALAWFHEIPAGNELVHNRFDAADMWRATSAAALALVVWYRLLWPVVQNWRYRLRVTEVIDEGPGVISLRISGRGLSRYHARAGQFFFWRFLERGFWYTQHPFSLSEAPNGDSFRITVKALGDHTARFDRIRVGTRVLAEGPFGVFTADTRSREKVLLIAGGIGITPVRALLEEFRGDVITVYRALTERDLVLARELDELVASHGGKVEYIVGDHATPEGRRLLTPEHLHELVPDVHEREIYACGPPAMLALIERTLRRSNLHGRHVHVERFAI
jgi:predicted ferric reductase